MLTNKSGEKYEERLLYIINGFSFKEPMLDVSNNSNMCYNF